MKNVVFGLFDELDDARRVLRQLADSPLDLDAVQIVHADPDVQHQLATEIGLPRDRAMATGVLVGGLLGAAVGAYSGNGWLAPLGPLLAAAGGSIVGAVAGALGGAMLETVRLPDASRGEIVAAIDDGGTAILVRTANLPTARAISDLFHAGGSRRLSAVDPTGSDAGVFTPRRLSAAEREARGHGSDPFADELDSTVDAGIEQHGDHEEIFAPPWRRTPFAMRPGKGAVAPPIVRQGDAADSTLPSGDDAPETDDATSGDVRSVSD
ncbi:MAG: hypothetical protein ACK2T6_01255 [Anaerolineae bacterium]